MLKPDNKTFFANVYNIVSQIPSGRVLTYGGIARLLGWPRHARLVGRALSEAPRSFRLPCQRVVNAAGRTAPGWAEQKELLRREGVRLKACADGTARVNLHLYEWRLDDLEGYGWSLEKGASDESR